MGNLCTFVLFVDRRHLPYTAAHFTRVRVLTLNKLDMKMNFVFDAMTAVLCCYQSVAGRLTRHEMMTINPLISHMLVLYRNVKWFTLYGMPVFGAEIAYITL